MMSLAEFIETYGTQAAQELLDLIFIKKGLIVNENARSTLIRWKVINKRTKFVYGAYNKLNWGNAEHIIKFYNASRLILEIRMTDTEIESLRASIYRRGEEQIA